MKQRIATGVPDVPASQDPQQESALGELHGQVLSHVSDSIRRSSANLAA